MGYCEKCAVYNKLHDSLRESWQDSVPEGEQAKSHFCIMYEKMPDGIWEGEKECDYFVPLEAD